MGTFRCFKCMESIERDDAVCPACGYDNTNRDNGAQYLGDTRLDNRYYVGRCIGSGGFGVTYIGYDDKFERKVAVKEYYPNSSAFKLYRSTTDRKTVISSDSDQSQGFTIGKANAKKEALRISELEKIPNVVSVYDIVEENNTVYIIMEFVNGKTIEKYVEEKKKLTFQETMRIMQPVMRALQSIHDRGQMHLDISPDNIMWDDEKGEAVLLDFGASNRIKSKGGGKTQEVADPHTVKIGYSPMEQYANQPNQRSDQYALCGTIYYMLTGERPVDSITRSTSTHSRDPLTKPSALGVKIRPAAETALMRGMSLMSSERYDSIRELEKQMSRAVNPALVAVAASIAVCAAAAAVILIPRLNAPATAEITLQNGIAILTAEQPCQITISDPDSGEEIRQLRMAVGRNVALEGLTPGDRFSVRYEYENNQRKDVVYECKG